MQEGGQIYDPPPPVFDDPEILKSL
jgi:hypothetical protein